MKKRIDIAVDSLFPFSVIRFLFFPFQDYSFGYATEVLGNFRVKADWCVSLERLLEEC